MKTNLFLRPLVLAICFLGLSAKADPTELPLQNAGPSKTLSPYFVVQGGEGDAEGEHEPLPLKKTEARVRISGVIADVEIRQVYRNTGSDVLEALYVFPASTRAAVHGLEMKVGDRTVEARIARREEAKKDYENAKSEGKTAALLEQERPNVFQMSVGHILPGDDVEVTLRYTESLVPTDRIYEFVFPTVVGPRYSKSADGSPAAVEDQWVANPFLEAGVVTPTVFDIEVDVAAGMPIKELTCATHPVDIHYAAEDEAKVGLDGSDSHTGDRDFVLRYRLAGNRIESGLLLHEDEERGENFFLLTVQPPKRVTPADLPGREYVFVVDCSGSMNGFPLDTAKTLLRDLVGGLRPRDRFNVLVFASGSHLFSKRSVSADSAQVAAAIRFLESQRGSGGTELTAALERVFELPADEGVSRSVVLLTDGYVDFERETFALVRERLGTANLFSMGIGSSVNRFLIEGLARAGQGEPFFVLDPGDAEEQATRLREMIAAPVLTDITIDFGKGFDAYDLEPEQVPDVFADRPLVIRGKVRGTPEGTIRVTGQSGTERRTLELAVEATESANPALPYLWARERIGRLVDDYELTRDDEAEKEVTSLGLTYHLLTRFTSFVAIDTVARPAEPDAEHLTQKQPTPLPSGVPNSAVGNGAAPEPTTFLLWLTGLASLLFLRKRRELLAPPHSI